MLFRSIKGTLFYADSDITIQLSPGDILEVKDEKTIYAKLSPKGIKIKNPLPYGEYIVYKIKDNNIYFIVLTGLIMRKYIEIFKKFVTWKQIRYMLMELNFLERLINNSTVKNGYNKIFVKLLTNCASTWKMNCLAYRMCPLFCTMSNRFTQQEVNKCCDIYFYQNKAANRLENHAFNFPIGLRVNTKKRNDILKAIKDYKYKIINQNNYMLGDKLNEKIFKH